MSNFSAFFRISSVNLSVGGGSVDTLKYVIECIKNVSNYETINPNPRRISSAVRNQSGTPTITRVPPPQVIQTQQGHVETVSPLPHKLTFISNDSYYKPIKKTSDYEIKKLIFPDPEDNVIWASLKINVFKGRPTDKIKSDEPILYTIQSGRFSIMIYEKHNEFLDMLYATEKIAIPPGVVHRFINSLDDRSSTLIGEFPYDVMVSENNISGKKEEEVILRPHQQTSPHQTEENLVETEAQSQKSQQPAVPPRPVEKKKSQPRNPPQK